MERNHEKYEENKFLVKYQTLGKEYIKVKLFSSRNTDSLYGLVLLFMTLYHKLSNFLSLKDLLQRHKFFRKKKSVQTSPHNFEKKSSW